MTPTSPRARIAVVAAIGGLTLSACGNTGSDPEPQATAPRTSTNTSPPATEPSPTPSDDAPLSSDGRPVRADLSIRAIGLTGLDVVPYEGWTDDAPGTAIQNKGRAASPYGPRGGTGPGGIGNYQVTAHRLSSTKAFLRLPELSKGDRVHVRTDNATYVYRITHTRRTSFRSPASLRAQRAAVPGRPGQVATQAMITLSTCATPEDHAVGNYWADEFDNPEHRIDKIGVLVEVV